MTQPRQYSDKELQDIASQIAGPFQGIVLPGDPSEPPRPLPPWGVRFVVVPSISELEGRPFETERLWNAIKALPNPEGIAALSSVNSVTTKLGLGDGRHRLLEQRFLEAGRLAAAETFRLEKGQGAFVQVFSRPSTLLLQRVALALSPTTAVDSPPQLSDIGELALMANTFITGKRFRTGSADTNDYLSFLVEGLPYWDINNGPDLALGLTRAALLLQRHLDGSDPVIVALRKSLGVDLSTFRFDGMSLDEYIACVFGLYAWMNGRDVEQLIAGKDNCVINTSTFLGPTKFPASLLDGFINRRGRTVVEFRELLGAERFQTVEGLRGALEDDTFIADTMVFRQFPFCRISPTDAVCLDATFLSELIITGVYWEIVSKLTPGQIARFMELWGRLMEKHTHELLRDEYPTSLSPLKLNVAYEGGEVDALLDFGEVAVLFEVKSSLLKASAKYDRDPEQFRKDFALKFVENDKGSPKALRQLANAAAAALESKLGLSMRPKRVIPILVGYESSLDSFWMNRYADDLFKGLLPTGVRGNVRPVTLMSVETLEIILPHLSAGDTSWTELLERRFFQDGEGNTKVVDSSVYQAWYDWRAESGVEMRRNAYMKRAFDDLFVRVMALYSGGEGESAGVETN